MITTPRVIHPPKITEGTIPNAREARPLSNCPSSLLELINIELTLLTLPRMWSGVFNCITVPRTTTLIPSSMPAEKVKSFGENVPLGRAGQPVELAPVYVMLASDEASYVTGARVAVTGGRPIL